MSVLSELFKRVKHWEYGAIALDDEAGRRAYQIVALEIADRLAQEPADNLDLLRRIEILRACNLHTSERHPERTTRERAAGAADCCARLLASFAGEQEEVEHAVANS